jgi:NADH-quinone oxidoreductase subunit G
MATIHVDGKEYEVDGADNLLRACLSLGLDIPYFCWHPALGSVGACRQCAVKQYADADDTRGRLVMSCMTPATDNTFISIDDAEAVAFRESVIEWLMINHPHDCPVCAEGGHCHLQDMTVMTGHASRRYRFTKRTHRNQDLGPFIAHEMNRCIACYRCVRYYKDYADGPDLGVFGAHDNVYFGRVQDGVLESEFAGNLTEVCPTGVFTDKTHAERYNRKWDMQFAPSICHGCASGCNISPGERYGELRRIENRYHGEINRYFLCDRGRFGYGYVNRKDRPRQPWARIGAGELDVVTVDRALATGSDALRHAKRVLGIGSPRASLEANFTLRELVGAENFSTGMSAAEQRCHELALEILRNGPVRTPTLRQVEASDAVFVLGEDVTQTAARLALALRQATKGKSVAMALERKMFEWQAEAIANIGQGARHPLFIASVEATRLDDAALETLHADPDSLAQLGFAVAHAIDSGAPAPQGLSEALTAAARRIADTLLAAEQPLIVSGVSLQSTALLQAAANIAAALHARGKGNAQITLCGAEVNSAGVTLLGGQTLQQALQQLQQGEADALVVLENDLYRRADAATVDAALAAVGTLVVIDHQRTATAERATLLLPAGSFAESDGTVVSSEGRAQRYFQVYDPVYYEPSCQIRESWRWLHALHSGVQGQPLSWTQLDTVTAACAAAVPALAAIGRAAPDASFRIDGMKLARSPHRYSGRTATRANLSVHEPRASQDVDSALAFSMEGFNGAHAGEHPGALIPFAWSPGWNSPQAWNRFQDEVGGHLRAGDPGVRLIEPAGGESHYFAVPAVASESRPGQLRAVPLYSLFGSDEMSARSAVAERAPEAVAVLAAADADRLGVAVGEHIRLNVNGARVQLPVRISAGFSAGDIGLTAGLDGVPVFTAGDWVALEVGA